MTAITVSIVTRIATVSDVTRCTTVDMVLDVSGTAWEPRIVTPEAAGAAVGGFRAVINPANNRVLAFVGRKYRTNSHVEHIRALAPLVESGDLQPVSVSSWDDGAMLAYQFRANGLTAEIAGHNVSSLFTLVFVHNGEGSDLSFFADFRWTCKNQMGKVRAAAKDRVKHVGPVRDRYADLVADQVRALSSVASQRYSAMRRMAAKPLRGADVMAYWAAALGQDPSRALAEVSEWAKARHVEPKGIVRTIRDITEDYRLDDAGAPLTVWHALNGLTRYVTHSQGRDSDLRSRRALLGEGSAVIDRAWGMAARLAA